MGLLDDVLSEGACPYLVCVLQIEETQSLLAENARLNEEVADLKRSLIRLETLRGST